MLSNPTRLARFDSGQIVSTPGALAVVSSNEMAQAIARHLNGDWGDLDHEDIAANNKALLQGGRLVSAYSTTDHIRFWVITECDRSATTILLPSEY